MGGYKTKTFTFEGKRYFARGKTAKDAAAKAAVMLHDLEAGKRQISKNMPVSEWAKEWAETYKEPVVNAKQYKAILSVIDSFINPAIGSMQIKNVKPVHLQKIMAGTTKYLDSYISKIYDVSFVTKLELKSSIDDPWGCLPVNTIIGGAYAENNLLITALQKLEDVDAEATMKKILPSWYDRTAFMEVGRK